MGKSDIMPNTSWKKIYLAEIFFPQLFMSRAAVKNLRKTLQSLQHQVERYQHGWNGIFLLPFHPIEMNSALMEIAMLFSTHYINVSRKVGNDPFEFDHIAESTAISLVEIVYFLLLILDYPIERIHYFPSLQVCSSN